MTAHILGGGGLVAHRSAVTGTLLDGGGDSPPCLALVEPSVLHRAHVPGAGQLAPRPVPSSAGSGASADRRASLSPRGDVPAATVRPVALCSLTGPVRDPQLFAKPRYQLGGCGCPGPTVVPPWLFVRSTPVGAACPPAVRGGAQGQSWSSDDRFPPSGRSPERRVPPSPGLSPYPT